MALTSDTLMNLTSGLGTARDKAAGGMFVLPLLDKSQIDSAYRGDWIAKKIVDIPAFDETREWRDWQADKPQIEKIEAEEARLSVQAKVSKARKLARLYGGAVLFIGTGDADPMQELRPDSIKAGGLKYLHVFSRHEMVAGELEQDPLSPFYGEPVKYSLAGRTAMVDVHPSRVVRFIGAELPDRAMAYDGWGDTVLQAVYDAVMHAGSAAAAIAGFQKRMKGPHAVKVGFPSGTTGRHPGGLVDIVQIAIWNHYGTAGSGTNFVRNGVGGFGGPIPPRPFITVAIFKHRRQIRKLLKEIYIDILHGKTTAELGLSRLGQYGVSIIQDSIKSGNWAPNSPLTVRIKGSSRPLIDGGHMVGAVTFALEGGGQVGGQSANYRGGKAAGKAFGRALAKMFGGR